MLIGITILIMLLVAAAFAFEGLFSACLMLFNVLFAGLVAFNFWEPMASLLESALAGTRAVGYEDAVCLVLLFWITLGLLRLATNFMVNTEVALHPIAHRVGGAVVGLFTGYLLAGFLVCVFQTLPWEDNTFESRAESGQGIIQHYLPPDKVWLGTMRRAGTFSFSGSGKTFDPDGTFTARYARHRRS
jgi:hypothetical protein